MFELIMGSIMLVVAIALLLFGIFRLKYYYDMKIVEYKAEKNLETQMELINQLPEMTRTMMDSMTESLEKWAEVMKDI